MKYSVLLTAYGKNYEVLRTAQVTIDADDMGLVHGLSIPFTPTEAAYVRDVRVEIRQLDAQAT